MNSSHVIGKEQCPECRKLGKDNSEDNLAIYSDGHKYCFSCRHTINPNKITRFKVGNNDSNQTLTKEEVFLPSDCNTEYPQRAIDWISKYELTRNDLLKFGVLWSDCMQRLIFPVYGESGNLLAWQGRTFHLQNMAVAKIPKWYGKGDLKNCFNVLGKGDILVLTEDIVSAIKVAKSGYMAMPLYGCVVGRERFKRLFSLFEDSVEVRVWLDFDKITEGVKESKIGALCGLTTATIVSIKDPKEYSYTEIKEIITKELQNETI